MASRASKLPLALAAAVAAGALGIYLWSIRRRRKDVKKKPEDGRGEEDVRGVRVCEPGNWPPKGLPANTEGLLNVVSWNTLCGKFHFKNHDWVPEECKPWEYRRDLLWKYLDSFSADVFCLQEKLRNFAKDFGIFMASKGYDYITADPKYRNGHDHVKPVIFYRRDRLVLKWYKGKSRTVVGEFQVGSSRQRILIASCHLQGGHEAPTRFSQAKSLLKTIDARLRIINPNAPPPDSEGSSSSRSPSRSRKGSKRGQSQRIELKEENPEDLKDLPPPLLLITGDMNAFVEDPCMKLFRNGFFNKSMWNEPGYKPEQIPRKINYKTNLIGPLTDAYERLGETKKGRPHTYQWGAPGMELPVRKYVIDYILYANERQDKTSTLGGLKLKVGIPNHWYPSDHFPLSAIFELPRVPLRS
ncbi:hypothetical protein AAMO2058_001685600 [Amorphochlora amoebiformis]